MSEESWMMNSSANDAPQETPMNPDELSPEGEHAAAQLEAVAQGLDAMVEATRAPSLAEPGMYWCAHESPGEHPILGLIQPGENDYSAVTDVRMLEAIAACVASGLLEKR